jgi:hypothetical protein
MNNHVVVVDDHIVYYAIVVVDDHIVVPVMPMTVDYYSVIDHVVNPAMNNHRIIDHHAIRNNHRVSNDHAIGNHYAVGHDHRSLRGNVHWRLHHWGGDLGEQGLAVP